MKKGLLILSLFLMTSCTFPFPTRPQEPTTNTTPPTTQEPTTPPTITTEEPTTPPTTTEEPTTQPPVTTEDITTQTPTTETPTTQTPTTETPTTETPTPERPTTGPVIISLQGLYVEGSLENKNYSENDDDWDLTGLDLFEIYSNDTEIFAGDLEQLRNSNDYTITVDPVKPVLNTTSIEITVIHIESQISTTLTVDGIVVSEAVLFANYYTPDSYFLSDYMPHTYSDFSKNYFYNMRYSPSVDDVNILVAPVAFTDSTEDTSQALADIKTAFTGTEEETGWESVKTYFDKSSYGNLNLEFTILDDWYQSSLSKSEAGTMDAFETAALGEEILTYYKENVSSLNGRELDSNSDGFVDCIFMVYSEKNYQAAGTSYDNFWAYCFSRQQSDANVRSPTSNMFVWSSYAFMYPSGGGSYLIDIDAHTFIHELGHAFGLEDYYDYGGKSAPAGGFDMQDFNVGDHNSFSKFALGWTKPYVVYGDSEITLKPTALYENQFIIIPVGGYDEWNGSPFDEYILLEYYTPEGNFYFDSHSQTYPYYPTGSLSSGIRAYHVDARLFEIIYQQGNYYLNDYKDEVSSSNKYVVAATNSSAESGYESLVSSAINYDLLHLLSASGTNRFGSMNFFATQDLFVEGDKFNMTDFAGFFPNRGRMNDGSALGFSFEVTNINSEGATIQITVD